MAANYYLLRSTGEIENIPLDASANINELTTNAALGYPHDSESSPYMGGYFLKHNDVYIITHGVNELSTFKGSWRPAEINTVLRRFSPDSPIVGNVIVVLTRASVGSFTAEDDIAVPFPNLEEVLARFTINPDQDGSFYTKPTDGQEETSASSDQEETSASSDQEETSASSDQEETSAPSNQEDAALAALAVVGSLPASFSSESGDD